MKRCLLVLIMGIIFLGENVHADEGSSRNLVTTPLNIAIFTPVECGPVQSRARPCAAVWRRRASMYTSSGQRRAKKQRARVVMRYAALAEHVRRNPRSRHTRRHQRTNCARRCSFSSLPEQTITTRSICNKFVFNLSLM